MQSKISTGGSLRFSATTGARRVALIVAAAYFMQNLDGTIINTSLPQMASVFRVRPADLNVGITAYILSTAAFLPLSGWAADRLGAKRVFAGAIVIFALASLACGFSQNLWQFSAARIVQGLGGALMAPVGRMVVMRSAEKADLLAAGVTRSMQFTALATMTFADIEPYLRASSTTLSSMLQQVSMGLGIAVGAVLINVSQSLRGADGLALADFRLAFFVVGLIAVAASALFLRLDADAGAEVSGHRPKRL
jgi:MFS family permease